MPRTNRELYQAVSVRRASSWLGNGLDLPLAAVEQIHTALGNQKVQALARSLGIPADKLAELLATNLSQAVDKASPNGGLTPQPDAAAKA